MLTCCLHSCSNDYAIEVLNYAIEVCKKDLKLLHTVYSNLVYLNVRCFYLLIIHTQCFPMQDKIGHADEVYQNAIAAAQLAPQLPGVSSSVAYNKLCALSMVEARQQINVIHWHISTSYRRTAIAFQASWIMLS